MRSSFLRPLPLLAFVWFQCDGMFCQSVARTTAPATRIEPGLETAVSWKWWVVPSDQKDWGLPLPEPAAPKLPGTPAMTPVTAAPARPETYEVKKGDALILIAKKFDMKAAQLKAFNDLKDDRIRIGQVLRIPNATDLQAMAPAPEPEKPSDEKKKKLADAPKKEMGFEARNEMENVRLQVFLDREQFSPGPIDGKNNATFLKTWEVYSNSHDDAKDAEAFKAKARAAIAEPFTRYKLRPEDFRFILPPKPEKVVAKGKAKSNAPVAAPPVTYGELTAAPWLGYLTPWEFVAERFHCDESFLRHLNLTLKGAPVAGTEFQVPDVIPFEIEKVFERPLQPAADPQKPVTAAVVELSRLEIFQGDRIVATMPLASARPALRGKGSWKILDSLPGPRLATKREPKDPPKTQPAALGESSAPAVAAVEPILEKEQYLAAGPNNPVGVIWINLAKSADATPLPYGLHGTGIPAQMNSQQGLGGFRLSNWDIARAARLLPSGTVLQWKQRQDKAASPASGLRRAP
jgi:LysM repeat protein